MNSMEASILGGHVGHGNSLSPELQKDHREPAQLVRDASGGDSGAWSALVDRFAPLVWSVARSYRLSQQDAADVSQTTWLRLAEHIDRLREPERVGAWLATTAGRESLAVIRRRQREVPVEEATLSEPLDGDFSDQPAESMLRCTQSEELWRAFSVLPVRSQLLLRLLFADPQPSYQEIATLTGMPIGSIGPTRARCLRELRELLENGTCD
ncbi:MAG: polymerase, sigma-24 subunit, subfamily [Actinobacteria bacterium]|jgi:RNA polymerase sigma factor (sigma-70 family)|nr:polymerase, sigma-24 subunit, subfamily [Actinomycetota bacterium]